MNKKIIAFIVIMFSVAALTSSARSGESDKTVFERSCGQCHSTERSLTIDKTTRGWEKTVDWMQGNPNSGFSREDGIAIKGYLKTIHTDYGQRLFESRCAKCHPWQKAESLRFTGEQWRNLVLRERARAITWIHLDEAEDISAYLSARYNGPQMRSRQWQGLRQLSEDKCLRCHTHKTVFQTKRTKNTWKEITERMRTKIPAFISNEEAEKISGFLDKNTPLAEWE